MKTLALKATAENVKGSRWDFKSSFLRQISERNFYLFKSGWRLFSSTEIRQSPHCIPCHSQSSGFGQKPETTKAKEVSSQDMSQKMNIESIKNSRTEASIEAKSLH